MQQYIASWKETSTFFTAILGTEACLEDHPTPPKYGLYPLKMKVVGSHGSQ